MGQRTLEDGCHRGQEGVTGGRRVSQRTEHNEPGEAYLLASSPLASYDPSVSLRSNFSSSSLKGESRHVFKEILLQEAVSSELLEH